jgi:hypothetical protein
MDAEIRIRSPILVNAEQIPRDVYSLLEAHENHGRELSFRERLRIQRAIRRCKASVRRAREDWEIPSDAT